MKKRPDLGFGTALEDLSNLNDRRSPSLRTQSKGEVIQAAREAGFGSRETSDSEEMVSKRSRRRRTGRNAQLNIKATPETIEEYCRIADQNGWGLGETLEHAVALLQEHAGSN